MKSVAALLAESPVVLAPMEDVSGAGFRKLCRSLGAVICVTEFVRADQMIANAKIARRKTAMEAGDRPTAIQIYGADARLLLEAARAAQAREPTFVDINCGCWVPKISGSGAGAGWLRDPAAMVAMARDVVAAVDLPVTIKTRIGWGPESHMPIVDLARRLEDAGVAALTIHCRTANMGHSGAADWAWARRAREVVRIPVVVNGDIATAGDVARALADTGCAGVMVGRGAIVNPWLFGEAHAALAGHPVPPPPSDAERVRVFRALLDTNIAERGEFRGVRCTRRHVGVLGPMPRERRDALLTAPTVAALDELLAQTSA